MLILDGANDKIQVQCSAAIDLEVQVSWMHNNAGTVTPGGDPLPSITGTTATDIVTAPGASQQRNVKNISGKNNHATDSATVTFTETDGTNTVELWSATLLAGEMIVFDETGRWTLYDVNGQEKAVTFPVASQADMEAASSLVLTVTPGRAHFHPGVAKFWVCFTGNSTTILGSYNMTSITDGTTEATVTIATDFSGANTWCCHANSEGATTSVAAARLPCIRAQAAGSVIVFCTDAAATPALQDPTRWHVSGFGDHA